MVRECRRHSRGQNTTYHLAKFFASLIKISSVGPTRSASRLQTPEDGVQEQQPAAVSGEALTAKLNAAAEDTTDSNAAPQDFFQVRLLFAVFYHRLTQSARMMQICSTSTTLWTRYQSTPCFRKAKTGMSLRFPDDVKLTNPGRM